MKTNDRLALLFLTKKCDRVRGYWYGYHGQHGPARDFLSNAEYVKGWKEGDGLRWDERRAFQARLNRSL